MALSGRLARCVALVTGGSTGMGAAVVKRFVGEGTSVMACARHEPQTPLAEGVTFVTADVTDEDDRTSGATCCPTARTPGARRGGRNV